MRIYRSIYSPNLSSGPEVVSIGSRKLFNSHIWLYKLEKDWEIVDHLDDADIVPMFFDSTGEYALLKKLHIKKTVMLLSCFHIDEYHHETYYLNELEKIRKIFPNVIIVHKNKAIQDRPGLVYYDCMFNRQKLFCTEYHKIKEWKNSKDYENDEYVWTVGSNEDTYKISTIDKNWSDDFRHFLFTGLVYHGLFVPRMRYRNELRQHLKTNYSDKGYISDKNSTFLPNNPSSFLLTLLARDDLKGGFWYPVSDDYYKKTLMSFYVETLTGTEFPVRCVTEKTFDPLIKGNFILPFSYPNFFKDVLEYGFLLPDFIDISYDSIVDNESRFIKYVDTINDLLKKKNIKDDYLRNEHVVKHNQNVFYDKPYYPLYDKVKSQIENRIPVKYISNL
jgi:hypothetical protein